MNEKTKEFLRISILTIAILGGTYLLGTLWVNNPHPIASKGFFLLAGAGILVTVICVFLSAMAGNIYDMIAAIPLSLIGLIGLFLPWEYASIAGIIAIWLYPSVWVTLLMAMLLWSILKTKKTERRKLLGILFQSVITPFSQRKPPEEPNQTRHQLIVNAPNPQAQKSPRK